jgi:hypothetical protein
MLLVCRHASVQELYPDALGVDDFIARVETVLSGYGFTGENSIGEPRVVVGHSTAALSPPQPT